MKCGNCGRGNEYDAKICAYCNATLALTEYYRPQGFVEEKNRPTKAKHEPWDQDILTAGYRKRKNAADTEEMHYTSPTRSRKAPAGSAVVAEKSRNSSKSAPVKKGSKTSAPATRSKGKTATRTATTSPKTEKKKTTTPGGKKAPTKEQNRNKLKKIPSSKVYNHTTRTLSLAEKEIQKKAEKAQKKRGKKAGKTLLAIILVAIFLIAAAGIFIGTIYRSSDADRFTEVAKSFVEAVVMGDEAVLEECVHPKMQGVLRPVGYENVDRCDTKIVEYEEYDLQELQQTLQSTYGISETLTGAYRVRVGCTIYAESTYAHTMDVVVADIGGSVYGVEIEISQ